MPLPGRRLVALAKPVEDNRQEFFLDTPRIHSIEPTERNDGAGRCSGSLRNPFLDVRSRYSCGNDVYGMGASSARNVQAADEHAGSGLFRLMFLGQQSSR
jgi:hypothetical protein